MKKKKTNNNFGVFWQKHKGGNEWYTWMYNYRIVQHQAFEKVFCYLNLIEKIQAIADFGCGTCVGYTDFFKDHCYVGIDLAAHVIDWCKSHYNNPKHEYRVLEFIEDPPEKEFDLVFSQGTIDNTYDMNAFFHAAVLSSKKWIYVTAYRGYFPQLKNHKYTYSEDEGVYYNDISPIEAYDTLKALGCNRISIYPSPTGYEDISFETVIVAHV